jgi:hypothetical protein
MTIARTPRAENANLAAIVEAIGAESSPAFVLAFKHRFDPSTCYGCANIQNDLLGNDNRNQRRIF